MHISEKERHGLLGRIRDTKALWRLCKGDEIAMMAPVIGLRGPDIKSSIKD